MPKMPSSPRAFLSLGIFSFSNELSEKTLSGFNALPQRAHFWLSLPSQMPNSVLPNAPAAFPSHLSNPLAYLCPFCLPIPTKCSRLTFWPGWRWNVLLFFVRLCQCFSAHKGTAGGALCCFYMGPNMSAQCIFFPFSFVWSPFLFAWIDENILPILFAFFAWMAHPQRHSPAYFWHIIVSHKNVICPMLRGMRVAKDGPSKMGIGQRSRPRLTFPQPIYSLVPIIDGILANAINFLCLSPSSHKLKNIRRQQSRFFLFLLKAAIKNLEKTLILSYFQFFVAIQNSWTMSNYKYFKFIFLYYYY